MSPRMARPRRDAARFYDRYHSTFAVLDEEAPVIRRTMAYNREMLGLLDPAPGSSVLDLSCGQGLFLKAAADSGLGLKLHGLDHSRVAVEAARRRVPEAQVRLGDALSTGYPSARFDGVTCLGALEHYPDSGAGLKEIRRILRPGGRAVVYVPNLFFLGYVYLTWRSGETPHEAGQNEYERFETRQGWEGLIRSASLRVVNVTKYNDMFASERVPAPVKWAYQAFLRPFIPLNLSYCFAFLVAPDA